MNRSLMRALFGLALITGLAGCGGSELKPDQQKEYDRLQDEKRSIDSRIGKEQARSEKAFRDLGAAEKRKRRAYKHMVMCGARADGQAFGPFPWGQKRTAKLDPSGTIKVSGTACRVYKFEVVK